VGYSLDELRNDITAAHAASFEPTIDYVVTKIPRFTFEKFPDADATLTSAMKSVGEAMAIRADVQGIDSKCLRSLEIGARGSGRRQTRRRRSRRGGGDQHKLGTRAPSDFLHPPRVSCGLLVQDIFDLTKIDPWFLHQLKEIFEMEQALAKETLASIETTALRRAKQFGFSDAQLAHLLKSDLAAVRAARKQRGVNTTTGSSTRARRIRAFTPYYYSSTATKTKSSRRRAKRKS